ncbi:MAG: ribosome biogenesis GTP-binding protein YihA/YsxC [Acidobacteriota bacterium]
MKIASSAFVKSAFSREHWVNGGLPEVAFLGRSNVGKSSLINSLLRRKGLARTSNTPGRTQSINFFLLNNAFHFVDLPGYGYARVSKVMKQDWGKMAEEYLAQRDELALSIQLVDARHEPTPLDRQLNEWLVFNDKRHLVVATKSDKLSNNELAKRIRGMKAKFEKSEIIAYSTTTGRGRDELLEKIRSALEKS